jgi:hypothetical protein
LPQVNNFTEDEFFPESKTSFWVELAYPVNQTIPMITLGSPGGIHYYDATNGTIIKNYLMKSGWIWSFGDKRFFEYDVLADYLECATDFKKYSKDDPLDPLVSNNVTFHYPSDSLKKMMLETEFFYQSMPISEPVEEHLSIRLEQEKNMSVKQRFEAMQARSKKLHEIHRLKRASVTVDFDEPLITRWYSLQREDRLKAMFDLLGEAGWICAWLSDRVMVMSFHMDNLLNELSEQCAEAGETFKEVRDDSQMCEPE